MNTDDTVTIYDVAVKQEFQCQQLAVSLMATSVKENTRKVLEVIDRGLSSNAVARGLASKKTATVGVVIEYQWLFLNAC